MAKHVKRMICLRHRNTLRLLAAFCSLAVILAIAPISVRGEETAPATTPALAEQQLTLDCRIGFRYVDANDNPIFVSLYDPQKSSVTAGLDVSYYTMSGTTFIGDAAFNEKDDWLARLYYNRAASVSAHLNAERFFKWDERKFLPAIKAIPLEDKDPTGDYHVTLTDLSAGLKVRMPSYPAHVSADIRSYTKKGTMQNTFLDMSCGGAIRGCHAVARSRKTDQRTQEFNVGADAHLGWVDVAYNRNGLNFEDKVDPPVDLFGPVMTPPFQQAGPRAHNANPESASFSDTLKINSILIDRLVASFYLSRGEVENEDANITEGYKKLVGDLTFSLNPQLRAVVRYRYDKESTESISAAALAAREGVEYLALKPGCRKSAGEFLLLYNPSSSLSLTATVQADWIKREETERTGLQDKTQSTQARLDAEYALAPDIKISGRLGYTKVKDPAYQWDSTSQYDYWLNINWTPASIFGLEAIYQGSTGKNEDFNRDTSANNLAVMAMYAPMEMLSFMATYNLMDNAVEQDMAFGMDQPGYRYYSLDTPFRQTAQSGSLQVTVKPIEKLTITATEMVINGTSSYDPEFAISADLKNISKVDFIKWMTTVGIGYEFDSQLEVSLDGSYIDFDNKRDDRYDGTMTGVSLTVSKSF